MIGNFINQCMKKNENSLIGDTTNPMAYSTFGGLVHKHAANLRSLLKRKAKCVVYCEHEINAALAILAVWDADMTPIPMSPNYGTVHNLSILDLTKPHLIVTDSDGLIEQLNTDCSVYSLNTEENHITTSIDGEYDIDDDVALIMCTSGTTGVPKGAMITEKGLICNIKDISKYFPISNSDRILIARPLYHCAVLTGEFIISLFRGVNIYFIDSKYNPFNILEQIKNLNITVLCGTPTLFCHITKYSQKRGYDLKLKYAAVSGECLNNEQAKEIRAAFPNTHLFNVYGLTEASPRVCYLPSDLFDDFPGAVGKPLESVQIMIVDEEGKELKCNCDGELLVKGPNVMKGYYRKLSNDKVRNGWLYTGDIASIDDNGLLYIKSRVDDLIIKAGMNIYPKEIENEILKENCISDVLAYKIENNRGVQIGLRVILDKDFENLSLKDIYIICTQRLPEYQIPDKIEIVEFIEKNGSGKKNRKVVVDTNYN